MISIDVVTPNEPENEKYYVTMPYYWDTLLKLGHYNGKINWDSTKPNGTPRKLLDVSKATALGWTYKTELEDGIRLSYEDFLNNPMRAER